MPELPEVETVRRGLEPAAVGARIKKVELRRGDIRFPFPPRFAERLQGRRIVALGRRAKYLLFRLDSGDTLIAHLGMSGSFRIESALETEMPGVFHRQRSKDPKHDHVVLHLDNGKRVTYNDPRRFGFMDLASGPSLESHPRLSGLGDEPLAREFDAARLAALFAGSRAPLKAALLDQKRIAGLGNIYASEALFRARLAPSRPAGDLANARGRPTRAAVALAPRHPRCPRGGRQSRRLDLARPPSDRTATSAISSMPSLSMTARAQPAQDRAAAARSSRMTQAGRSTFYCPVCQM